MDTFRSQELGSVYRTTTGQGLDNLWAPVEEQRVYHSFTGWPVTDRSYCTQLGRKTFESQGRVK